MISLTLSSPMCTLKSLTVLLCFLLDMNIDSKHPKHIAYFICRPKQYGVVNSRGTESKKRSANKSSPLRTRTCHCPLVTVRQRLSWSGLRTETVFEHFPVGRDYSFVLESEIAKLICLCLYLSISYYMYDLLDLFAFHVLVVRPGRLSNLHNLLGEWLPLITVLCHWSKVFQIVGWFQW